MDIQKLTDQEKRVETGPVQFGDDWPGVFIRGDKTAYFALCLKTLLDDPRTAAIFGGNVALEFELWTLQSILSDAIVGPAKESASL